MESFTNVKFHEKALSPQEKDRLKRLAQEILHILDEPPGPSPHQETRAGSLEEKLLLTLKQGSQSKWDLIEKLYPLDIGGLEKENRFKNLIARLRKKKPGRIVFKEGRYLLAEPSSSDPAETQD